MGILNYIYQKLTGKNQAYETSEFEKVNCEGDEDYQNSDMPVPLINDEYETKLECMEYTRETEGELAQTKLTLSNNDEILNIDSTETSYKELSSKQIVKFNHCIDGSDTEKPLDSDANELIKKKSNDEVAQGISQIKVKQLKLKGLPLNHPSEDAKEVKTFDYSFTAGNMGKVRYYNSIEKYRDTDYFGATNKYRRRIILEEIDDYLNNPCFYSGSDD